MNLLRRRITPLHNLKLAYITAFCAVGLILLSSLAINQLALYRETISRQAAALESRQSVRSQRIGRDSLLLLIQADHSKIVPELAQDVQGIQQDRALLLSSYARYYPSFAGIDGGHGRGVQVYEDVLHAAQGLLATEAKHLATKPRELAEKADVTTIFYEQPEQLRNIQAAQAIIDEDTDDYIARIRTIDIVSSVLSVLVLLFEGFFVLLPAVRYFSVQAARPPVVEEVQHGRA